MTEIQPQYSQPKAPPQIIISDEHISKLEINAETILLVRLPMETTAEEGTRIFAAIQQVVKMKVGIDPGILMVARDCDLVTLDIEALNLLRAEIDATLQYRLGVKGN